MALLYYMGWCFPKRNRNCSDTCHMKSAFYNKPASQRCCFTFHLLKYKFLKSLTFCVGNMAEKSIFVNFLKRIIKCGIEGNAKNGKIEFNNIAHYVQYMFLKANQ